MDIQNKELGYKIFLEAGEDISISINGNEVFTQTVSNDKEAKISFKFQEILIETE